MPIRPAYPIFALICLLSLGLTLTGCDNVSASHEASTATNTTKTNAGTDDQITSPVADRPPERTLGELLASEKHHRLEFQSNLDDDGTGSVTLAAQADEPYMPSSVSYDGEAVTVEKDGKSKTVRLKEQQQEGQRKLAALIEKKRREAGEHRTQTYDLDAMTPQKLRDHFENQGFTVRQQDDTHLELRRSMMSLNGRTENQVKITFNSKTARIEKAEIYRNGSKVMEHVMPASPGKDPTVHSKFVLGTRKEQEVEMETVLPDQN